MDKCKPYTQAELDQQAIWADEFDQWWESEGQYHRAGGDDYCRTFAWWAWLSREQSRQSEFDAMTEALLNQTQLLAKQKVEVDQLQSQINEMAEVGLSQESVIREKDKRIEAALAVVKRYRDKRYPFNAFCIWMEKALRGEHE